MSMRPGVYSLLRALPLALITLLAWGCAPAVPGSAPVAPSASTSAAASAPVYPGTSWERIDPADSAGWSRAGLDSVAAQLATLPTTGFMAVVGGRVLMDYGDPEAVSYLASVRKSILSMLFGNYVADGTVRLDKTLAEMAIDDVQGLTDAEKQATIRDVLAARSGVFHPASNAGDDLASAPARGSQRPGEYYLYSNWDFNALGTIFEQETGRNIYDALETELARPIGMQDFDRSTHRRTGDVARSRHLAYHMNLSTRDMARVGYLMLREGSWAGRQVVPGEWVRESTRAITPVHEMNPEGRRAGPFGYGYLWWVWDGPHAEGPYRGAYVGLGAVGQHIAVLPALDMVVVHKTRPGQGRSVSHPEFLQVLDLLVNARRVPADAVARVDRIFARWNTLQTPGCAVAADVNGRTVLSRAYGMADLEHGIPNRAATIFEAGSVSKQFAAAALALLALDGKLSLDDDVRTHVPELPVYGAPITLRHLLNHTSGLRDWGSVAALSGWGRGQRTHSHTHVVDILSRQSALNYPPGEAYSYTNSGYNLIAVIVERVSGTSFAEFSRQRIFEPLGLRDTQWRDDYRRIVPGRAAAYTTRGDSFAIDRPIENVHGNGGLLTTVADLIRWDRALAGGEVGGPEFVRLMHEQGVLNDGTVISYASGVQIGSRRGVPEVSHTGATAGYRAFLARYPDQNLSVAVLCNVSAVSPGGVGGEVADVFLEGLAPQRPAAPAPRASAAVRLSAAELQAKAGLYRDVRSWEPLRLVVENAALRVDDGSRLAPLSPTVFRVGDSDRNFVFEPAASGSRLRIRETVRHADDQPHEVAAYEPVEAFAPGATELAAYTGTFHSDDAEATFTLSVQRGQLAMHRRDGARLVLTPVYPDVFRTGLGLVRFHRDGQGRISEFGVRQARVYDMRFQRVAD